MICEAGVWELRCGGGDSALNLLKRRRVPVTCFSNARVDPIASISAKGFLQKCKIFPAMSRYSRFPGVGSDERVPTQKRTTFNVVLPGGHAEEDYCNGTGYEVANDAAPRHRRGISESETSLKRHREGQVLEKQSRDESMPELFLGAPLEGMNDTERQTWQTQWTDALKKVQSLRLSGVGTQSERWSGIATDIYRPNTFTTQDAPHPSSTRTSNAPPASLDQWNYYPGPSVGRDVPQLQLDNMIRGNQKNAGADVWNSSLLGAAMSNREEAQQERASAEQIAANGRPQVMHQKKNTGHVSTKLPGLEEPNESLLHAKTSYSALASRVQRTQSHRYGRLWGRKPEDNHVLEMADSINYGASQNDAAVPNPMLKKATSMREGGAHADAVMQMARAYTDTMFGAPKTLECASCGRNLGVIVQGNPGVDIAFCQACRPSPVQWKKKPISENALGSQKKKKGIVNFCRRILRLDKKSS